MGKQSKPDCDKAQNRERERDKEREHARPEALSFATPA